MSERVERKKMKLKRDETGNGINRQMKIWEIAMGGAQSSAACFVLEREKEKRDNYLPLIACRFGF